MNFFLASLGISERRPKVKAFLTRLLAPNWTQAPRMELLFLGALYAKKKNPELSMQPSTGTVLFSGRDKKIGKHNSCAIDFYGID